MVRVGGAWRCFRIRWRLFESVRGFFDLTYVRSGLIFFCVDLLLLFSTWTEVLNGNEIFWQWIDRRVRRLNILQEIVFFMLVVVFSGSLIKRLSQSNDKYEFLHLILFPKFCHMIIYMFIQNCTKLPVVCSSKQNSYNLFSVLWKFRQCSSVTS